MLFNATGDRLVGTLVDTSQIASFAMLRNGRLRAAPGSPFPGQGLGQIGAEFRPTNPSQLFVTNTHNGNFYPKAISRQTPTAGVHEGSVRRGQRKEPDQLIAGNLQEIT